jgi:hypothetical protein
LYGCPPTNGSRYHPSTKEEIPAQAHLLDVQCILHEVWKDMEVSTIAQSWAKSKILDPTMEADIRAEHGSRTKVTISN